MLLSAVSNDGVGRFVTRSLGEYGVDTRHCFVTTGLERTSLAMAETTTDSPDVTIYRNDAADLAITSAHAEAVDVAALGAIIITGTALSREPSRSACERLVELAGEVDFARVHLFFGNERTEGEAAGKCSDGAAQFVEACGVGHVYRVPHLAAAAAAR